MNKIVDSIEELVGNTPILNAKRYALGWGIKNVNILAKLEYLNPAGSIKDRVALAMIDEGEANGTIKKGATLIEATSGNTGIGMAIVAASRGYKAIIVMPETMSIERRKLLAAYGAQIVLTEGAKGMQGSVEKAREIMENTQGAVILGQFSNLANVKAHINTTGPEIYNQTDGNVDIVVAGVGTGGTITGIGTYLKSMNPNIKVVAVEPASNPLLSKGVAGAHKIQGIGANFIPEILDTNIYDEIIAISDEEAIREAKTFAKIEGALVGISSGAALYAAVQLAKREENDGKNIVVILPDSGDRYLSDME